MRFNAILKLLATALVVLAVAAVVVLLLLATDTALSVWERLTALGPWAAPLYLALLVALALGGTWLGWRLLVGRKSRLEPAPTVIDRDSLVARLEHDETKGIETGAARGELSELAVRQREERVYLAMFGAMSVGKSSLINALLGNTGAATGATGGTTTAIRTFDGTTPDGAPLRLVDLPGFGHLDTASLSPRARDEAVRAHVVLYVCAGDLDRTQHQELRALAEFDKPIVVVLNKADHYRANELEQLRARIAATAGTAPLALVPVTAGGQEQVVVVEPDGRERRESRPRKAEIEALWAQIASLLERSGTHLIERQERSMLQLASEKLEAAEARHREREATKLIEKYSRRAVIGALAALTPGSDLVIQAALAARFLRELGDLYEIQVRKMDIDRFIELAGGRLKKTTALVLAIAGNALKAFPGAGTVAGGLVHAVAYGMIFDSLGRSAANTLATQKTLDPVWAADRFEDQMNENIRAHAGDFARLAFSELGARKRS